MHPIEYSKLRALWALYIPFLITHIYICDAEYCAAAAVQHIKSSTFNRPRRDERDAARLLGPIDIPNLQKGKDYYYFLMYFNSWLAGWLDFSARGAAAPARYDSFVYADTNTEESGESRGNGALYKLAGDDDTHNDEAPFNELLRYISNTTQLLLRRAPQLQCSFSFYEEGAGDEVEGAHCDKNDEEGPML